METHTKHMTVTDYFLRPGYIYMPDKPTAISAVVGSGVAVCVYDKKNKVGGMNLYKLPANHKDQDPIPIYGNIATRALVTLLIKRGSRRRHLRCQIFGGAFNSEISNRDIGKENIAMARQVLGRMGITIVSEDVGGTLGRKIVFNTLTSDVAILKTEVLRVSDWYPYEGDR
jgi:chemotaxis protein CheD